MKKFKRNAVILTVLLFVCVAVYLNWAYNKNGAEAETLGAAGGTKNQPAETAEDAGLYYTGDGTDYDEAYFAQARMNREEARSAAAATLSTVTETGGATQEAIDAAVSEISQLTDVSLKESELESLIIAKGFDDCVVYISDAGVSVTVPAPMEGLSTAAVARITDIVTSETDFCASELKVIEIKNA